jgi:hypothetical protein
VIDAARFLRLGTNWFIQSVQGGRDDATWLSAQELRWPDASAWMSERLPCDLSPLRANVALQQTGVCRSVAARFARCHFVMIRPQLNLGVSSHYRRIDGEEFVEPGSELERHRRTRTGHRI